MSLDKATVQKIAGLARIDIPDEQTVAVAEGLSTILEFVAQLSDVNTEGVDPMISVVATGLPLRKDKVTDGACRGAVLANATDAIEGFYTVPKMVE